MQNIKKITSKNIFTSKGNVLKYLQPKLKFSKIEKLYFFETLDFEKDEEQIINKIMNFFNSKIIIRSSAIGEDSFESSEAGLFDSVLDVDSQSKKSIKNAITFVIKSYERKNNFNKKNQILVQTQSSNITHSGVLFTKMRNGSPYYVINFEEGSSTIGVTQGKVGNLIKIFRQTPPNIIPRKWSQLIKSIKEIEKILNNSLLDIEFGITSSNKIIIFQVRPLLSELNINSKVTYEKKILTLQKKYQNKSKKLLGITPIFSDMADWNPSEIIGNNPNSLDYSLYDYLIMKHSWYIGRKKIGYHVPPKHNLMIKFGNKPYINSLLSFVSLTPKTIPKKIILKLLKFYNNELTSHPYLHDKIEFEIVLSCFDFGFKSKAKKLLKNGFTKSEINLIEENLLRFTNKIIKDFPKISSSSISKIKTMSENRQNFQNEFATKNLSFSKKLDIMESLLNDCKNLGANEFSKMARIAFIATIMLKGLVIEKYLSQNTIDSFLNSLETPLTKFQQDLMSLYDGKITKKIFLSKYGHLRPGTYDITQSRYDQDNQFLEKIQFNRQISSYSIPDSKLEKILKTNNLDLTVNDFLTFCTKSLVLREEFKFEFTKNLSDVLEIISQLGSELGFSKNELAYLDIKTILNSKKLSLQKIKELWKKKIIFNQKQKDVNNLITLPPLLFNKNDFNVIEYYSANPNFITEKSITSNVHVLKENINNNDFSGKIIILENADPGYDWIFSSNPSGLITKYGGVASHMSIRCSELDLPAAIGCGEIIFENLLNSSKIILDCKNKEILILEHSTENQFLEERKVLKSLGYIK